jgi:hypothetical protein
MTPENIGEVAMYFFTFRDQMKIYHFQTTSYARHIAIDQFVNLLTVQLDTYLENLQGTSGMKMVIPSHMSEIGLLNMDEKNSVDILHVFKNWVLNDLPRLSNNFEKNYKDLQNVQEDILSNINKTLYLFRLN